MPGIFNVPSRGLSGLSLDEVIAHAGAEADAGGAPGPADEQACSRILKRMSGLGEDYLLEIKGSDGQPILKTDLERDAANKLMELILQVPEGKKRRRLLHKIHQTFAGEKVAHQKSMAEIDFLRAADDMLSELFEWINNSAVFGKPMGSALHKFRDALASGVVVDLGHDGGRLPTRDVSEWLDATAGASVYLIEHDWAAAFEGAQDFTSGETLPPDEFCAFEMSISGKHVIAFALDSTWPILQYVVLASRGWVIFNPSDHFNINDKLFMRASAQVRAVTIALDAEVATTDVVRAPHKLNRARESRGKLPIFDYHVVSLSRRARAPALPADHSAEPGARRRFHFRRGHWRHYSDHKTWIKWQLVGDPDLGFVDKHYKL